MWVRWWQVANSYPQERQEVSKTTCIPIKGCWKEWEGDAGATTTSAQGRPLLPCDFPVPLAWGWELVGLSMQTEHSQGRECCRLLPGSCDKLLLILNSALLYRTQKCLGRSPAPVLPVIKKHCN